MVRDRLQVLMRLAHFMCCVMLGLGLVLQGLQTPMTRAQGPRHVHVELPSDLTAAVARISPQHVFDPQHPHSHLRPARVEAQRHWHAAAERSTIRVIAESDEETTVNGGGSAMLEPPSTALILADQCGRASDACWPHWLLSVPTRYLHPPERPPRA